jgi:putative tricarboxylic transport membrane protein
MAEVFSAVGLILQWDNLIYALIGFLVGCIGGAIPGIGGPLTLTLMMPFVLPLSTEASMITLIAAYSGLAYAGSVPAILMNTPGSPGSAAAAFDGYPMAKRGEGVTAISISAAASGFGSILGALFLIALSPVLVRFVLLFGSVEYFMLAVLGLSTIVMVSGRSVVKGLIAAVLGCLVAAIGTTTIRAFPRFSLGVPELYDGINLVAAFIGVFAIGEMLRLAGLHGTSIAEALAATGSRVRGIRLMLAEWRIALKTGILGVLLGAVPGQGATVTNFLAYAEARRSSKNPEEYGRGAPGGIVAVDSSNNAVIGGSLVPTLAFGIPGSGTTAILLVALLLSGIRPGPNMFDEDIILTYTMIGAVMMGGILSFTVGVLLAKQFSLVTLVPNTFLIPVVTIVSMLGAYVISYRHTMVWQALVFGVIGYVLIRHNFPIIAFILGLILGPLAELNLVRTYQISGGNVPMIFVQRPVSLVLVLMTVFVLVWPPLAPIVKARRLARQKARPEPSAV